MWTTGLLFRHVLPPDCVGLMAGIWRAAPLVILSLTAALGELSVTQGERMDVGSAMVGQVLTGIVEIKNTGQEKIAIKRISVSCGCSATDSDKESLAPGETAGIRVSFERRNLPASLSSDIIIQGVASSGREVSVKVQVLGRYTAPFLVSPSPIILTVTDEVLRDREITLQLRDIDPRIVSIKIKGAPAHVTPLKGWDRAEGFDTSLTFKIKLREMYYGANRLGVLLVGLASDGAIVGELALPLTVFLEGDLEPKPSQILALGVVGGKTSSRQILLTSRGKNEIKIVRAYSDVPWVACSVVEPVSEMTERILSLEISPNRKEGLGHVFVEYLDESRVCTLRLPVVQTAR